MSLTPEDLQQITIIMQGTEERLSARMEHVESAAAEQSVATIGTMRDMQTEILKGIEAFARGNFARMYRLETSDTTLNTRIEAIEERLLALELRQRPTQ